MKMPAKLYVLAVQCENAVDTLVRHLTKANCPQAFARISKDVAANLHKARQENAFLKKDVPALLQDFRESVVTQRR